MNRLNPVIKILQRIKKDNDNLFKEAKQYEWKGVCKKVKQENKEIIAAIKLLKVKN